MANISLLSSTNRVEVPYVKVTIGDYTFGVYQSSKATIKTSNGFFEHSETIYPNYVKSLKINKINGQVNTYTLNIAYCIQPGDDPNFFEKVFSSVSSNRKIIFSYGDMSLPTYVFKDEEAIITNIRPDINIRANTIYYTITAISAASKLNAGTYTFNNNKSKKPSDEIKALLRGNYGLKEIFTGMANDALVEAKKLIPDDDKAVPMETKTNISVLDYLNYLISCMIPATSNITNTNNKTFYAMQIIDDVSGEFGGTYFKIEPVIKDKADQYAYEIDVNFSTKDIIKSISFNLNETPAIYNEWQEELTQEKYVSRLNDKGEWALEYAPNISSNNDEHITRTTDTTWWTKITEYPLSCVLTIKGLLKPVNLMTYIRLNVYFYGVKYMLSGLYIITKEDDNVDSSGYYTTLSLTRIAGD